jgi:hypothetical protein
MIGYGGRSELSHFKSKTFERRGAYFHPLLATLVTGVRDLPLPAPSHSRPRLAGPSAIAGLKTLSLRPWHGPFHLPFNHRSPWRALLGCRRARPMAPTSASPFRYGRSRRPSENPDTAVLFVERKWVPSDDSAGTTVRIEIELGSFTWSSSSAFRCLLTRRYRVLKTYICSS